MNNNIFGEPLITCSKNPLTGFFRNGCCETDNTDAGMHTICVIVSQEFLLFSKAVGNDLTTPIPQYGFHGLKDGDIIIFSAHIDKYKHENDLTKHFETFLQQTKNVGMKFILISPTPSFSGVRGGYTCQEELYRPSWAISQLCFAEVKKSKWFAFNNVSISK